MNVTGIDPSLGGTAVCSGGAPDKFSMQRIATKNGGDTAGARISRYEEIVGRLKLHLDATPPRIVLIEGYSMGSQQGREYAGELGGLIRWHLLEYTPHIFEVAPGTLKKFITGSGAAKKEQIIAHVLQRWGRMFKTNDEADAFGLWQMALACAGVCPATNDRQREAVATVLGTRRPEIEALAASNGQPAF